MSKKKEVIERIFRICQKKNDFTFDNSLVKQMANEVGLANPFDATKWDHSEKLPEILKEHDYFIIHLGGGKHKFVKGIEKGYHRFESITEENIFPWKYRKSILNEFDTSESNILSVAFNQRILHDFLYDDIVANPKMYGSRRTKTSFDYRIGTEQLHAQNLQMEIDLTTEYGGDITVFEGKNQFPEDFAVYQLFFPYFYYYNLKRREKLAVNRINACYVLRKKQNNSSVIRVYLYTFDNPQDMTSIRLIKNMQYNLIKR